MKELEQLFWCSEQILKLQKLKNNIVTTKPLISALLVGGWIAIIITLVIFLIAVLVAAIFNSNRDKDYEGAQIHNNEISI